MSCFFVAIARAVVNHDDGGGTAPNPLVWSAGSLPKRRRDVDAVRNFAFLPGPVGIWSGDWVSFAVSGITVDDVRVWPYSVSLFVKMSAFLGTLHWPAGAVDFGVGGVSFVEMLILYELWAVRDFVLRVLFLSIGGLDVQFQCRLFFLVQALIFGAPVGFLEPSFVHCVCCLGVLVGFSLVVLGLITAGFGILVGRGVVMGLLHVLKRVLLLLFWISSCCFFMTLPGRLVLYLLVLFLHGIVLLSLLLEPFFGFCLFLAMLLGWLRFRVRLQWLVELRLLGECLDLVENDFD